MPIEISAGRTIGSESEFEQLEAALEAMAAGTLACVAVEGEPGIGKTRLLPSCAAVPTSEAAWSWRVPRRSSSATCRSALGGTHWTPPRPRSPAPTHRTDASTSTSTPPRSTRWPTPCPTSPSAASSPTTKRLVIEGFLNELIQRFEEGPVREVLIGAIERRLSVLLD